MSTERRSPRSSPASLGLLLLGVATLYAGLVILVLGQLPGWGWSGDVERLYQIVGLSFAAAAGPFFAWAWMKRRQRAGHLREALLNSGPPFPALVVQPLEGSLASEALLAQALDHILGLADFQEGSIFLVAEPGERLVLKASRPASAAPRRAAGEEGREAMARRALLSGKPVLWSRNPTASERRLSAAGGRGWTYAVAFPLESRNRAVGVLHLASRSKDKVSEEAHQWAYHMAGQLGTAIDNLLLYEEIREARDELAVLYQTALKVTARIGAPDLPEAIVEGAARLAKARAAILYLSSDQHLVCAASQGAGPGLLGMTIQPGRGAVGRAFRLGRAQPISRRDSGLPNAGLALPLKSQEGSTGVLCVLAEDGNRGFSELEISLLSLYANHAAVAMENAQLYQDLRRLAVTDGLTGLFNRRHFWQALERELARAQRYSRPLSTILLDVDGFKRYNDAHGHLAGDDLLRDLGKLLGRLTRQTDVVARYAGDEFVLILSETDRARAMEVAEKIRNAVAEHRFAHGSITVSLGVAAYPEDAPGDKSLVEMADAFLYAAKQGGRNTLGQVSPRVPTPSSVGDS